MRPEIMYTVKFLKEHMERIDKSIAEAPDVPEAPAMIKELEECKKNIKYSVDILQKY